MSVSACLVVYILSCSRMAQHALCIGASNYARVGRLPGTLNDVAAVASSCKALGFRVTSITDCSSDELHRAVEDFLSLVAKGDTVFCFFSGHGMQYLGDNYFVPIDYATSRAYPDPRLHAFAIYSKLIAPLQDRHTRLNFIALDACRAEMIPVGSASVKGSGSSGLAKVEAPLCVIAVPMCLVFALCPSYFLSQWHGTFSGV